METPWTLQVEAYGVALTVEADPELSADVERILPPGWAPTDSPGDPPRFAVRRQGKDGFTVARREVPLASTVTRELALGLLDSSIRAEIALNAPAHIFVHAGVVAADGRGIVLPGRSFTGKSTLVAALVAAGATYYSDEYAVLDSEGAVHPYPRLISLRPTRQQVSASALGGTTGTGPVRVSLVAAAEYRPDGRWDPQRLSRGAGALVMLENTVPARSRPAESLAAIRNCVPDAVILRGDRGEADDTAGALLSTLADSNGDSALSAR